MASTRPFSDTTTHGVRVGAVAFFQKSHSIPESNRFVFGYKILIHNMSKEPVTLLGRRWTIVNSNGTQDTIEGEGVVGHQPRLEPGQAFQYNSFAALTTDWGTMEGFFLMQRDDRSTFHASITRFFLTPPSAAEAQVADDVLVLGVA